MNFKPLLIASAIVALVGCSNDSDVEAAGATKAAPTVQDDASYAVGYSLGARLSESGLELNYDQLMAGLQDAEAGKDKAISAERHAAANEHIVAMQKQQAAILLEQAIDANLKAGIKFVDTALTNDKVVKTESGLLYEVISEDSPELTDSPNATSLVEIAFEARHITGDVFDTSYSEEGNTVVLPVENLLPGLREGVKLMQAGDTYRFVLKPELGYLAGSKDGKVKPYQTVLVDLKLLQFGEPQPPADNESD